MWNRRKELEWLVNDFHDKSLAISYKVNMILKGTIITSFPLFHNLWKIISQWNKLYVFGLKDLETSSSRVKFCIFLIWAFLRQRNAII